MIVLLLEGHLKGLPWETEMCISKEEDIWHTIFLTKNSEGGPRCENFIKEKGLYIEEWNVESKISDQHPALYCRRFYSFIIWLWSE